MIRKTNSMIKDNSIYVNCGSYVSVAIADPKDSKRSIVATFETTPVTAHGQMFNEPVGNPQFARYENASADSLGIPATVTCYDRKWLNAEEILDNMEGLA